jgi:hypothetical protein
MRKTQTVAVILLLALSAAGCGSMQTSAEAINQTAPGDPAGSANIGTGSVTVGATIPYEAKAAGMGLSP